jgi:hypothetical protein
MPQWAPRSAPAGTSGAKSGALRITSLPGRRALATPKSLRAPRTAFAMTTDGHKSGGFVGGFAGLPNPGRNVSRGILLARVRATRVTRKALASTSRCLRNLPGFRGSLTITDRDQRLGTRDGHGRGSWLRTTGGEATFERLPTHLPLLCPGVASPGPALAGRRELFIHSGRP